MQRERDSSRLVGRDLQIGFWLWIYGQSLTTNPAKSSNIEKPYAGRGEGGFLGDGSSDA